MKVEHDSYLYGLLGLNGQVGQSGKPKNILLTWFLNTLTFVSFDCLSQKNYLITFNFRRFVLEFYLRVLNWKMKFVVIFYRTKASCLVRSIIFKIFIRKMFFKEKVLLNSVNSFDFKFSRLKMSLSNLILPGMYKGIHF